MNLPRPGFPEDRGSTLPLVLLCFLVAFFVIAGVTAASSAFLEQRQLQSDCDAAAAATSSRLDVGVLIGEQSQSFVAPDTKGAQKAVEDFQENSFFEESTVMQVSVTVEELIVECHRVADVPFGVLFGWGDGLERVTTSSIRSPIKDS